MVTDSPRLFAAYGLLPGINLRLHADGEGFDGVLATTVELVTDQRIEVLVPILQRRMHPIPPGVVVRCEYFHRRKLHRFVTEAIGHSLDRTYEYLAAPGNIEARELRDAFRLETSISPTNLRRVAGGESPGEDAPEPVRATIADISLGGLCLVSQDGFVSSSDRLEIHAVLGDAGSFTATLDVVGIDQPRDGYRNRRIHCRFVDISRRDRDRIGRYLMKRQIEMRRDGAL